MADWKVALGTELGLGAAALPVLLWLPGELPPAGLRQSHCYPPLGVAPPAEPAPHLGSPAGGAQGGRGGCRARTGAPRSLCSVQRELQVSINRVTCPVWRVCCLGR